MSDKTTQKKSVSKTTSKSENRTDVLLMNLAFRVIKRKPPSLYSGPPYSLAIIGSCLINCGFSVKAFDFNETEVEEYFHILKDILAKYRPKVVGLSCESWSRGSFLNTVRTIRDYSCDIKIVAGGSYATQYYKIMLERNKIDCVVLGEGEITMTEIVKAFFNKENIENIEGLALWKNNEVITTPQRKVLLDLDSLPYPDYSIFDIKNKIKFALAGSKDCLGFDPEKHKMQGRSCSLMRQALSVLSSRGCIGNCIFCPNSLVEKYKLRVHGVDYFVDMLEHFVKTYNLRDFYFIDNCFTFSKKRTLEICRAIIKKRLKIRWAVMTRFDRVDRETLKLMAKAGCIYNSYGLESYHEPMQKIIQKNLDLSVMDKALKMTNEEGIVFSLLVMFGNPGDSELTVRKTLNKIRNVDMDIFESRITTTYPNTKLFNIACENGSIEPDYFENQEYHVPLYTKDFSVKELKTLSSMMQKRTAFIQLSSPCSNKCRPCSVKNKKRSLSLKHLISIAATRSISLAFYGKDPLMDKDFLKIIDLVNTADIGNLTIYSTARLLASKQAVSKLQKYTKDIITKIMVPFFSVVPEKHDAATGIKGSFLQSLEGMRNWQEATAGIYITKEDIPFIEEFVKKYLGVYFSEVEFIFYSGSGWCRNADAKNTPKWSEALPYLKNTIDFVLEKGRASFTGLPECMLLDFKNKGLIADAWRPVDEWIKENGKPVNISRHREKTEKIKPEICKKCFWEPSCEGLWKFYAKKFGFDELAPQPIPSEIQP